MRPTVPIGAKAKTAGVLLPSRRMNNGRNSAVSLGNPSWTGDPRFKTLADRKKNEDELDKQVETLDTEAHSRSRLWK